MDERTDVRAATEVPSRHRVVVTGLGVVTSIGTGRELFWDRLMAGCSGIGEVASFDTSSFAVHLGGEIREFDPSQYLSRLSASEIGRASQFAIAAARLAIADGNLHVTEADRDNFGVVVGTTSGEPRVIEQFDDDFVAGHPEKTSRKFIATYPCHVLAVHVASELGLGGEVMTIPNACAAGNHAIARAYDELRFGEAQIMLAGGADSFSRITYAGFARLGAISPGICQPFDLNRKGMIPGEGAAFLLLETASHARHRSAHVYAEVAGYGLSCDAHHMTAAHPDADGGVRAMQLALRSAEIGPENVDYISAHGTGTSTNDRLETIAIKRVFGGRAQQVPVSSIKSMLGHTMGAASAIEALACALTITEGCVPPTINLFHPDPECDLDFVPLIGRKQRVDVALNNSYAFGGNNSSVVFASYKD
jgi:3-oxoacyl-[acyl-carrier-protein] synthase II